jgi:hypothetical protein
MADQDQKLNFLYKAIDDAQNLIKLVDAKTAVASAPLAFMIGKVTANLQLLLFDCNSVLTKIFASMFCVAAFVSVVLAFRVLFPTVNPGDHVHIRPGQMPQFFLFNVSKSWRAAFSSAPKHSMLDLQQGDYERSLEIADANLLQQVLIGELFKVSYVREIKTYRLKCLSQMLWVSIVLFATILIVGPRLG